MVGILLAHPEATNAPTDSPIAGTIPQRTFSIVTRLRDAIIPLADCQELSFFRLAKDLGPRIVVAPWPRLFIFSPNDSLVVRQLPESEERTPLRPDAHNATVRALLSRLPSRRSAIPESAVYRARFPSAPA